MEISGDWLLCDDGVTRPVAHVRVIGADGNSVKAVFLIDSGADRTVFSASLLKQLQLPISSPPPDIALVGVGGSHTFVSVSTALEFDSRGGAVARIRGAYAPFVDASALDFSILGRDVLDHFDVILSKRRGEVLLLAAGHGYLVVRSS